MHPTSADFLQKIRLHALRVLLTTMFPGSESSSVLSPCFSKGVCYRAIRSMWIALRGSYTSALIHAVFVNHLFPVVPDRRAAIISLGQWWKMDSLMN